MVLHLLYLKSDLENVASVKLRKDTNLCLNVKNPLSDWEVREKVVMNPSEPVEQEENTREPPHHLALKWEGSKKASIATILDEVATKTALKKKKNVTVKEQYAADDSGQWVAILALECRGLEPTAFFPLGDDFVITSMGGKEFIADVDLSEGDFAEYDDENDEPVSLSNIEFKWESV